MFSKLATVTAAAVFMSASAFAQTSDSGGEADHSATQGATDNHQVWSGATGEVFFSDMEKRTMRPEAEWPDRWMKLSDDQRAEAKRHCKEASETNRDDAEMAACAFVDTN